MGDWIEREVAQQWLERAETAERDWYDAKAEFGQSIAQAHKERDDAKARYEQQRVRAACYKSERDDARAALGRWVEVIDDVCGIQPVSPPDDLMATLSRRVFEWRQRITELEAALRQTVTEREAATNDIERLRTALEAIRRWDCLWPEPRRELCADFPWLRRLVDEALGYRRALDAAEEEPSIQRVERPKLGATLRRLRELHGMTMGDMAEAIGVSVSVVSDWELDRAVIVQAAKERFLMALMARDTARGGSGEG